MSARIRTAVALAACATVLCACGAQLESLPAPDPLGGAARYTVTAQFRDVGNLTLGAKVKIEGAVIGDVTAISTHDYVADVKMDIEKKFPLARNARFQIRFTTPLGEDFVAVTSVVRPDTPRLAAGATVPLAQTNEAPTIEDTFAAVSMLLNGGGLDQIHIIATELQIMLHGRTGEVRDLIGQLQTVLTNLDAHKHDIDRALDALHSVSRQLADDSSLVTQALAQFPATIDLLNEDTGRLTTLLGKVQRLGGTVRDLLGRSSDNMATMLDNLRPTLDALRAADGDLIPTFNTLIRFGALFDRAAPGDYVNLYTNIVGLLQAPGYQPRPGGELHSSTVSARPVTGAASIARLLGGGTP